MTCTPDSPAAVSAGGGRGRILAIAVAAGTLFGGVSAALSLAATWAIAGLLDAPSWVGQALGLVAALCGVVTGGFVAVRTWQAEYRLVASAPPTGPA